MKFAYGVGVVKIYSLFIMQIWMIKYLSQRVSVLTIFIVTRASAICPLQFPFIRNLKKWSPCTFKIIIKQKYCSNHYTKIKLRCENIVNYIRASKYTIIKNLLITYIHKHHIYIFTNMPSYFMGDSAFLWKVHTYIARKKYTRNFKHKTLYNFVPLLYPGE